MGCTNAAGRSRWVDATLAVSEREGWRRRRRLTWNFHGSQAGSPDREAQKWSEQTLLRRAEAERGGSSRDSILCGSGGWKRGSPPGPVRPPLRPTGGHTRRPVCKPPPAHFENSQKGQRDARCNAHAAARHECAVWPPSAARPPRLTPSRYCGSATQLQHYRTSKCLPARLPARIHIQTASTAPTPCTSSLDPLAV